MTDASHAKTDFFSSKAGRILRDVLAAVIALAFLGLVIFLAAMLTAAFLVLAGVAMLAGGAYWLWRKLRLWQLPWHRVPEVECAPGQMALHNLQFRHRSPQGIPPVMPSCK